MPGIAEDGRVAVEVIAAGSALAKPPQGLIET
jgi:hypothetical protein